MRSPYRVAVWGPGFMGQAAIRELVRLPETDLVGVFAYNESKNGVDAGTLAGIEPIGVKATTKANEILTLKPECVIYTARDFGDYRSDSDIIALLEAGINVVTVLSYQYPKTRGREAEQRLIDAGRKGGATLHGTGLDPGFLYERLAALMTGISNDIQYIRLDEYFNCGNVGAEFLRTFGFGNTLDEIEKDPIAGKNANNYLSMAIQYMADKLGVPLKRIEMFHRHKVVDHEESIPGLKLKAGMVGTVSFEWKGYTHDERPMFQIQVNWYLNDNLRPAGVPSNYYWILVTEGIPSSRVGVEITGSFEKNLDILPQNPVSPGWLGTIIPAIQAIPLVINAEPGIYVSAMPDIHWKPDMRG